MKLNKILLTERLALSAVFPLFVNLFGRSLRICHLEFDEEAISDVSWHISIFLEGVGIEF